ncbi:MAG: histidine kinase [Pseudomonadota bacterium]
MPSINQNNAYPVTLPDFCNLGVMLRVLVIVNLMGLAAALVRVQGYAAVWGELQQVSLMMQPALLLCLALLCGLKKPLLRLPYHYGVAAVLAIALACVTAVHVLLLNRIFMFEGAGWLDHAWLLTGLTTATLLVYFNMRSRILSPAIGAARLQALQARIRPHFLFNSINAVMSLVRSEPQRAERALQDLADLFRVLMKENRELVRLEDEVNLCWQYLELENLRLGDRLQIAWHIDKMPKDAMVPPLILQPLLENAVYHGIEPAAEPGEISVNIFHSRDQVNLVIKNPYLQEGSHHAGNKMAMQNIRERLQLHFDAEARLKCEVQGSHYLVHITLPYVKAEKA